MSDAAARIEPRVAGLPSVVLELAGYGLASGAALACDYGLLLLLTAGGLNYLAASAASFSVGMVVCYGLSVRFVFRERRPDSREAELVGFFSVGIAGLLLTQVLMALLVSGLDLPVAIAKIPTTGLVFLFNFVCRRSLVFAGPGTPAGRRVVPKVAWSSASVTGFCLGVALAVAWGLGHPFVGIEGDARVYMGRALADLDPSGVGRDLAFLMDGQSAFTIFGAIARTLVGWLGLGRATAALSLTNLVVWFAAVAIFVRGIAPGRAFALVLALVVILPRDYTPWNLFPAGETIAVPRPLAEAAVILALAAICRGRLVASVVCLLVAAAFHPIMAAPGACILLVAAGLRDRRWFIAAGLAAAAFVAAALSGVPVASRLVAMIDPPWRQILALRNPYLFLSAWPAQPFVGALVRIVTIVIGGALLEPRVRTVLWASVPVALAGCATSYLFCDLVPDVLVSQAQLWRWLWPIAALAPVAAGVCVWRLPERGVNGQLALASLCAAWLWMPTTAAVLVALLALGLVLARPLPIRPAVLPAVWVVLAILAIVSEGEDLVAFAALTRHMPAEMASRWGIVWSLGIATIPLGLLAFAAWRWPTAAATRVLVPGVAVAGLLLLPIVSDARTQREVIAESGAGAPDLAAMLQSRPGPVLWLDLDEIFYWVHRPNWNSKFQGAGLIFAPGLAPIWQERAEAVIAAGLANRTLLNPWEPDMGPPPSAIDPAKIRAFCRRPDAPAWIVTPAADGAGVPPGLGAALWTAPAGRPQMYVVDGKVVWKTFRRSLVIPCGPGPARAAG